ncbi:MAG TPA: helix-turn-helix transcriptional regulator [Vicinamibacterales bacterium]|jgi:DNA-binding PadR family transcriptional regulator
MSREFFSNFELMVLLAVIRLDDEAYGVPIAEAIEESTGRDVVQASVYNALDRLEGKGLLTSQFGDPTPERGGKAKRYFKATAKGVREAKAAKNALTAMWKGIPSLQGGRA